MNAKRGQIPASKDQPARVYFDLSPVQLPGPVRSLPASHPWIRTLRLGPFRPGVARLVAELHPGTDPTGFGRFEAGRVVFEGRRSLLLNPGSVDLDAIAADLRTGSGPAGPPRTAVEHAPSEKTRPPTESAWARRPSPGWRRVVIDAGHGGKDQGASRGSRLLEKDVNLSIARRVQRHLTRAGVEVVMTRSGDRALSLEERVERADRSGAELLVSVHANAHPSRELHGVETFHARGASPISQRVAAAVQEALVRRLGARRPVKDLGVKTADFFVLSRSRLPAVLVEVGFLTHPEEGAALGTSAYQEAAARAIAHGILAAAEPSPLLAQAGRDQKH